MRRILIAMGVLFTGLIGVALGSFGTLGVLASHSAENNKSAAIALVETVSESWSIDDSYAVFTPAARAQASTRSGRRALAVMSRLGQLHSARDAQQTGYAIDFETGTTVTITFDGRFDHGSGEVTVVLRFSNNEARIVELDLKKIRIVRKRQRRVAV